VVVIGEELVRGKPDPLPYLTALAALGVAAGDALAFEDSLAGVGAAPARHGAAGRGGLTRPWRTSAASVL